ncbi:unnamed protein product [Calypogeia fissa]
MPDLGPSYDYRNHHHHHHPQQLGGGIRPLLLLPLPLFRCLLREHAKEEHVGDIVAQFCCREGSWFSLWLDYCCTRIAIVSRIEEVGLISLSSASSSRWYCCSPGGVGVGDGIFGRWTIREAG